MVPVRLELYGLLSTSPHMNAVPLKKYKKKFTKSLVRFYKVSRICWLQLKSAQQVYISILVGIFGFSLKGFTMFNPKVLRRLIYNVSKDFCDND